MTDDADYDLNGYAVHRGVFTRAEMADLTAAIERASASAGSSTLDRPAMTFHSLLFPHSAELQAFLSSPTVLDLVRPVLGDDLWVRWDQAVVKGPGAPIFPWHQDNGYSLLLDEHVQVWISLTDVELERGALWVVPGSHRATYDHDEDDGHVAIDDEVAGQGRPITTTAGDVVLFSSRTLHRTTPNETDHERWTYVAEYLPLGSFDPWVEPPYFRVARRGRPDPAFVSWPPGR
ncbi:MAG: phytanoyl-CoA dioxygenase family protein, partial [Actinomycetota bacterium]